MVRTIDEVLIHLGEYSKFQILLNAILCVLKIPFGNILLIPYFSQHNPAWRCVKNSSACLVNGTHNAKSELYTYRCNIPRSEWEYTQPKEYSVVTQVSCTCSSLHSIIAKRYSSYSQGKQEPFFFILQWFLAFFVMFSLSLLNRFKSFIEC